ncbi:MAG: tetratricopeptide repeat protein [Candidatus Sulfobium sp.]|jgi:tetratricopeptide (TPR) repeat protein
MTDKTSVTKEAQKYLAKGQIDKAIAEWEKLVAESPDGNTFNVIGDLCLKKGDRKAAVESFHKSASFFRTEGFSLKALALYKKVLNIDPHDSAALFSLGQLSEEKGLSTDAIKYYLAAADLLAKKGKKDRILDIYETILSLSPSNIPLRNRVAEIFLKEGLVTSAAKEYIFIAGAYDEQGDYQSALDYFRKALDVQPLNKEAVLGISYLYEQWEEGEKALEHIREAAVLFPEDTDVLYRSAELSLKAGLRETAEEGLRKVLGMDAGHMKARSLLGEIYLKGGLKEKAWEEYLPVIDNLLLENKYDEAARLLEDFREADPLETGKRLVSLYRQLGENDRVRDELVRLGDILKDRDMIDEALSCYRDALEITPADEGLKEMISSLKKEPAEGTGGSPPVEGKTAEEIFTEADVFSRYGLLAEAIKLLEGLKPVDPQNIDLHTRLKTLYSNTGDQELAVTECLILHELYKRLGETESADKIIGEAFDICPDDPRLAGRGQGPAPEPSPAPVAAGAEEAAPDAAPSAENYEEELAEADFYASQGLTAEAENVLERLKGLYPDDKNIEERLSRLARLNELKDAEEPAGAGEIPDVPSADATTEPGDEAHGQQDRQLHHPDYEDLAITDQDLVDAQEVPEPTIDDDVMDIFQEFKKGLEQELEEDDSETHYNLGIAYKEMGLVDDAIKEFQLSRNDAKRFIQSSTMLGVCYMEKSLYPLAIETLQNVIGSVTQEEESYWPIKYDLASAYEKNGQLSEALALYTEVYGWDAGFRDVSQKINDIKTRLGEQDTEKPKEKKNRVSYL